MGATSTLEEEALKRKERLKALKRKKENGVDNNTMGACETLPKPKFRSYQPENETLKEGSLAPATVPDIAEDINDQLEAGKSKVVIDELDITNLAPRKPDWDLKRDVAKKLEKLEKRTQRAIAELIRERLKERQQDLATMVNQGTE